MIVSNYKLKCVNQFNVFTSTISLKWQNKPHSEMKEMEEINHISEMYGPVHHIFVEAMSCLDTNRFKMSL